jgi:hypothetical protein
MPNDIRIEYHPSLYVPREEAESKVLEWLAGNGRLLTITSPPATGKSWLLKHIREAFLPGMPFFWLDVREFLAPAVESPIASRKIDDEKLAQWLTQFLQKAGEACAGVPEYDAGVETAVLLEGFAKVIQQCHLRQNLYLLVEGGDEPTEETWYTIERQILEPIARIPNWRFIIALRQEQRLISYLLRRDEQRLVLGTLPLPPISDKGKRQIDLLWQEAQITDLPNLDTILSILPGYPWSHPGLNHFLFLEVKANYQLPRKSWLNHDYCSRGLCAITQLPLAQVTGLYTYLQQIVNQLDADWTPDELMANFDLPMSKAWERIEALKSAWLVENVARNRFKITDGVREFVQ